MNPDEEEINVVEVPEEQETVSTGEVDSSAEDEKEKKKARRGADGNKKRGNDASKKINDLWLKVQHANSESALAKKQANDAAAKNSEYEKITAAALEENLNTKRELLKERLVRAQENDDKTKVAEFTAELSKIEAQSAQIERYKIENQVKSPQEKQKEPSTQEEQVQQPLSVDDLYDRMNAVGKKWIDDNRDWYDPSSESYNEEMAQDVTLYAQSLERIPGGFPAGTKGYFKQINEYIKQNWSDAVEEDEEPVEKTPPQKTYSAPVGNRGLSQTPTQGQRKEYKITQAEKEMALNSPAKGKDGRPLSDADKIKRFISIREGTPKEGPISRGTIRKGN